jgi:hypothetical protein
VWRPPNVACWAPFPPSLHTGCVNLPRSVIANHGDFLHYFLRALGHASNHQREQSMAFDTASNRRASAVTLI